jgi:hypothetical protein
MTENEMATGITEDGDDFEYAEMPGEVIYDFDEGNVRNYIEVEVESGSDNARLYFEGRHDDGEIGSGYQYLNADELEALIAAAEKALSVVQANS